MATSSPQIKSLFSSLPEAELPERIWIDGNFDFSSGHPRIAIVGSRRPTAYGVTLTRDLGRWLAARGAVVVSGLAYGVDRLAHLAALEAGAPTIAVIGTGLGVFYPMENRKLQEERIPKQGAVITELAPGTSANASHFPARNRLIAALSSAVIVVEGNEKSGALITARCAAEQGKDVFAVPGSIYSAMSRAPNRLIKEGAIPLTMFEDLLESVPVLQNAQKSRAQKSDGHPENFPASLNAVQRKVWELLESGPMKLEEIAEGTETGLEDLSRALMEMQLAGWIRDLTPFGFARNMN